jgi:uncharacterized damage-inducible protein DinB
MRKDHDKALREQLANLLSWEDAHVGFQRAVAGLPAKLRGQAPQGFPHSPWQIMEHMRRAQHDILDFCVNPNYGEMKWPDDYWPAAPGPKSDGEWKKSLAAFRRDLRALQKMALNPKLDLFARIPHGSGQTYLRELLLVADHNAYHVGQLVAVRKALGAW